MDQAMAKRIKELRERAGLTQSELAKRAGLEQGHISRIERGAQKDISLSTLQAIARALAVPLAVILEGYEAHPAALHIEDDELLRILIRLQRVPEEKRKALLAFVEQWVPNMVMNDPATRREPVAV